MPQKLPLNALTFDNSYKTLDLAVLANLWYKRTSRYNELKFFHLVLQPSHKAFLYNEFSIYVTNFFVSVIKVMRLKKIATTNCREISCKIKQFFYRGLYFAQFFFFMFMYILTSYDKCSAKVTNRTAHIHSELLS